MKIIKQKTREDRRKPSVWKKVIGWLLFLLMVISLIFYGDSLKEIFEGIRRVKGSELCTGVALAMLGYVTEGLTIACMMGTVRETHFRHRSQKGIFIAFVCEFYRLTTLGNGSGIAEIHYLHREGIEPGSATVLTMVQYGMKKIAIILLGILGFVFQYGLYREYTVFVGIGCFITAAVIVLFLCLALSCKVGRTAMWFMDWMSRKIPSRKENFSKWKEQITLLNRSGREILGQRKKMLCVVLCQIGKLLLFYSIPACFLGGKTPLTAGECICSMALAFMLAGIIPAPSGAGSLEFTFLLFFTHFTDLETAVPAIVLFRFATWICPAIAGGGMLLWDKAMRRR